MSSTISSDSNSILVLLDALQDNMIDSDWIDINTCSLTFLNIPYFNYKHIDCSWGEIVHLQLLKKISSKFWILIQIDNFDMLK